MYDRISLRRTRHNSRRRIQTAPRAARYPSPSTRASVPAESTVESQPGNSDTTSRTEATTSLMTMPTSSVRPASESEEPGARQADGRRVAAATTRPSQSRDVGDSVPGSNNGRRGGWILDGSAMKREPAARCRPAAHHPELRRAGRGRLRASRADCRPE